MALCWQVLVTLGAPDRQHSPCGDGTGPVSVRETSTGGRLPVRTLTPTRAATTTRLAAASTVLAPLLEGPARAARVVGTLRAPPFTSWPTTNGCRSCASAHPKLCAFRRRSCCRDRCRPTSEAPRGKWRGRARRHLDRRRPLVAAAAATTRPAARGRRTHARWPPAARPARARRRGGGTAVCGAGLPASACPVRSRAWSGGDPGSLRPATTALPVSWSPSGIRAPRADRLARAVGQVAATQTTHVSAALLVHASRGECVPELRRG